MEFNSLEEKCRYYQGVSNYKLEKNSYVICHLDGRAFSKMVKNKFKKPFDDDFVSCMNRTAEYLCKNVQGVKMAYVQSDEITLVMTDITADGNGTMFFDGRLCKMQSILASMATGIFNKQMLIYEAAKMESDGQAASTASLMSLLTDMKLYEFDCKCWNVPNANDALAWVLYRQIDCVRNSKQQAAQTWLSHRQLHGKTTDEQVSMLKEQKGIDWNDYPDDVKYGRFVMKRYETRTAVVNGKETVYQRSVWSALPAAELTDAVSRAKIMNIINVETSLHV